MVKIWRGKSVVQNFTAWKRDTVPSWRFTTRWVFPTHIVILSQFLCFAYLHQLRKRYRLPCPFPPKKLRNSSSKVLETRRAALEQYVQGFVRQCQKNYKPLPPVLLEFLQVPTHVPKISSAAERVGSFCEESLEACSLTSSSHRPIVGFTTKEPFLFESSHALHVSPTGLPDIITQATLQCFYQS